MKVVRPAGTVYEQKMMENLIAEAEDMRAVQDYNLMMGNLEDPYWDDVEGEEDGAF